MTFICAAQNFLGQWHCSQVSGAGRRLCNWRVIGRGKVLKRSENLTGAGQLGVYVPCRACPTWQSTQARGHEVRAG